mmetsp:Transcript_40501/g.41078  ORF Transcript_40501/g.41078 Transcript_40501/m.41078 type:complete len:97 (+) Transcript_40501:99-389(+)
MLLVYPLLLLGCCDACEANDDSFSRRPQQLLYCTVATYLFSCGRIRNLTRCEQKRKKKTIQKNSTFEVSGKFDTVLVVKSPSFTCWKRKKRNDKQH